MKKVRCIDNSGTSLLAMGQEYEVVLETILGDGSKRYYLKGVGTGSTSWCGVRFETVSEDSNCDIITIGNEPILQQIPVEDKPTSPTQEAFDYDKYNGTNR
jgi:hypothetical protein